jgi:energy-converting hydrogenase Eha subunit F
LSYDYEVEILGYTRVCLTLLLMVLLAVFFVVPKWIRLKYDLNINTVKRAKHINRLNNNLTNMS